MVHFRLILNQNLIGFFCIAFPVTLHLDHMLSIISCKENPDHCYQDGFNSEAFTIMCLCFRSSPK